jgi:hypothetical protein
MLKLVREKHLATHAPNITPMEYLIKGEEMRYSHRGTLPKRME